jgi:hypothetical protein
MRPRPFPCRAAAPGGRSPGLCRTRC